MEPSYLSLVHRSPCVWTMLTLACALYGAKTANAAATDEVRAEVALIAAAKHAAKVDDDLGVERQLASGLVRGQRQAPGVVLARRAAAVCGWLQNDGDYGRAMRVARRAIRALAAYAEETDRDRATRLYWEAWLEGEVLDHRARALELLQGAAKLAPDDDHILAAAQRWASVLAEFGENPAAAREVAP